jgi:hypothetical protein
MDDKKILSQGLDQIVKEMIWEMSRYSFTLGDLGNYIEVDIYLGEDRYYVISFGIEQPEIERFKGQRSYNSYRKDIHFSIYDPKTHDYYIDFKPCIKELLKNNPEVEDIIIDIETLARSTYNTVLDSHLDPSKNYNRILMSFEKDTLYLNKIIKEIEESIIIGQSTNKKSKSKHKSKDKSKDKTVYEFIALKEKKNDLSYPDYYKFGFRIYEL